MKINWGVGIVIAFGLFITFILYFVVMVQSDSKYDNDLVVEEYYKHDECKHSDTKYEKILWPEDHPENDEFAFKHIKHQQWFIIQFNERQTEEYEQVKNTEPGS